MELTDGRTTETRASTENSNAQDNPQSQDIKRNQDIKQDVKEDIAKALVATRDARKRCDGSKARRLQADEREEDRGITEALGRE
jgi:hypothetical protein